MRQHLVGFLIAFAIAWPFATHAQDRPAQVGVDKVVEQEFVETKPVLGRFVAEQQGVVAARVAGPVAEILVSVGEPVDTGSELVKLDLTRLQIEKALADADLAAARSDLATAEAELALLEQERIRIARLEGSAAFSRARLDDKETEIIVAQSRINSAQARVSRAEVVSEFREIDIRDGSLRAPYPGVIVRKLVSAGAYVQVGDPVLEMVNNRDVEIEADVPAEAMSGLVAGTEIVFQLNGQDYPASLRAVIPIESAMTRTRAVRFTPKSAAETATIGETVTVQLPLGGGRQVVTVHKDAVLIRQGGRMVYVIDKENAVRPQMIDIGAAVGNRFEVVNGLNPGDLVVVRGNERLRPGQSVKFETVDGPAADGESKPPTAQRQTGDRSESSMGEGKS